MSGVERLDRDAHATFGDIAEICYDCLDTLPQHIREPLDAGTLIEEKARALLALLGDDGGASSYNPGEFDSEEELVFWVIGEVERLLESAESRSHLGPGDEFSWYATIGRGLLDASEVLLQGLLQPPPSEPSETITESTLTSLSALPLRDEASTFVGSTTLVGDRTVPLSHGDPPDLEVMPEVQLDESTREVPLDFTNFRRMDLDTQKALSAKIHPASADPVHRLQALFLDPGLLPSFPREQRDAIIEDQIRHGTFELLTLRSSASQDLRGNREVMLTALKQDAGAYDYLTPELRGDPEFQRHSAGPRAREKRLCPGNILLALEIIENTGKESHSLDCIRAFPDSRPVVLACVRRFKHSTTTQISDILALASQAVLDDRTWVMALVKANGHALSRASKNLRGDADIALTAVRQSPSALQFVPATLPNYRELAMEAVGRDGGALLFVHDSLRGDPDIALTAVRRSPSALQFVPATLPNYRELVVEAVGREGNVLRFVPESLRGDPDIALTAVRESPSALQCVPATLPNYRELVVEAVGREGNVLRFVPESLRRDPDIALTAVRQSPFALQYVSATLPNYRELAIEAVGRDGDVLSMLCA